MRVCKSLLKSALPLILTLCNSNTARPQEKGTASACDPEILVGVTVRDGQLVRGLTNTSFSATIKKRVVSVSSAAYDRSGRRIVLVVDRGSKMNDAAQTLAKTVVTRALSNSRPQDSFALITSGPDPLRVPFGTPPAEVLVKFSANGASDHSSTKIGVLDAIAESAGWFQAPRRGDALFVFSGDDKFNDSRAKFNKTLRSLQQQGIRVFAMLFGYIRMGTYYTFWNGPLNGPGPGPPLSSNVSREEEDLNNLAYGTGGYLSVENTHDVWQRYKLNDDRTKEVERIGWQLYGGIAETYILRFARSADEIGTVRVGLAADVISKVPGAVVVQSRNASECEASPGKANPDPAKH